MNRNLLCLLAGLTMALAGAAAHGKECKGVAFPDQMQSDGAALKLNGLGLRQATMFRVNVYVAALYLAQTSADADAILGANAPRQLVMHFVRDVGNADLTKAWDEGFENNAKSELPSLKERIEAFKGLMADMKAGERIGLSYKPGAGVQVAVKGAVKGTIAGDDFARALFAIWLGPHPPNAGLKAGLLGGQCE